MDKLQQIPLAANSHRCPNRQNTSATLINLLELAGDASAADRFTMILMPFVVYSIGVPARD